MVPAIGINQELIWLSLSDTYYSKNEIDNKFSSLNHLQRMVMPTVDDIRIYMEFHEDANQYIFMVPTTNTDGFNRYNEYVVISITDEEGITTNLIEEIGSWEVDLSGYVKIEDLEKNYVKKEPNARLITEQEVEQFSLGEKNVINSTTDEFIVDTAR
jgi:hypothetical protein